MLELRLEQDSLILLKKVLESVKDQFGDANFDFSSSGFDVQAAYRWYNPLVALRLRSMAFAHYKCDTSMSIGMNFNTMAEMLKYARKDDTVTLKAKQGRPTVTFIMKSPTQQKVNFTMNLVDFRHLFIPEAEDHDAIVTMPSAEFASICKDFSSIGDTVEISVTNDGLKFSTKADFGAVNMVCRQKTTPENSTIIKMEKPVSMTVALTYLNSFTKATVKNSYHQLDFDASCGCRV